MAKIGIMGGTFDPIHNGHLLLGRQAYQEYDLDEVWYMPSGIPPHKKGHKITDAKTRCEMIKLAIADFPYFKLSDFEIRREGNTYTAQTLQLLKEAYPQHKFYFVVGADSLYQIESWYQPEQVLGSVVLLAAHRDYPKAPRTMEQQRVYLMEKYHADIRLLHCPDVDIASEQLREMHARGSHIFQYVPKAVEVYIDAHHLYQE